MWQGTGHTGMLFRDARHRRLVPDHGMVSAAECRSRFYCLFVCFFLVFFSAGSRRRGSFPRLQVMDVAKVTGHAGTGASGTLRAARNSSQLVACLRPIIFRIPRNVSISLQRNGSRSLASPSIEWVSVFIFRSIFHFSRFSFRFHRFKKGPHRLWWCGR